jgi:hypothetical protein
MAARVSETVTMKRLTCRRSEYAERGCAALEDLKLEKLWVVYPGHDEYPLDEKILVIPAHMIPVIAEKLRRRRK